MRRITLSLILSSNIGEESRESGAFSYGVRKLSTYISNLALDNPSNTVILVVAHMSAPRSLSMSATAQSHRLQLSAIVLEQHMLEYRTNGDGMALSHNQGYIPPPKIVDSKAPNQSERDMYVYGVQRHAIATYSARVGCSYEHAENELLYAALTES